MGVVRDWIESDVAAVTEWVARKLHNHNPLRVRSMVRGGHHPTMISLDVENHTVLTVAGDGQAYRITVEALGGFDQLPEEVRVEIKDRPYSYNEWMNKPKQRIAS
jgi:hypothetical protein